MKVVKNKYAQYKILLSVLSGETAETDPEFQQWLTLEIDNKELYNYLNGRYKGRRKDIFSHQESSFNKDQAFENIKYILGLEMQTKKPFFRSPLFNLVASVAIIVILYITGYYMYQGFIKEQTDEFAKSVNKETLQNVYVPKGIIHEVILSDSTKVILNSESRLVFPTKFTGKSRIVELIGEAFFEVSKKDAPFIVKTAEMQINVTGTSFNVSAYQDNLSVQTTLVEGKVQITIPDKPDTYTLNPGNNFSLSKSSEEITIQKVNTDKYTSWMRGELIFRNQRLEEIFITLKRWYDFDIEYNNPHIRNMRFTGSVEKKRSLDYFLKQILTVTDIKYKYKDEKVILF
ncbi:MAG: DUF4974 domain-containing protein [Tannerella sp.]|jgi:hypothetical protein|nr:DUF4974 domain-containing protein [Tannerella sp.]